ncbi:TetR/AcrR family transcriptional regulator [Rothia koreensis]|uniref:TetR/AcrR family transcriptional regulator n=1 Tax=Rothia koreensis TaxID=592378 RepID=UPI0015C01189
MPSTPQRDASPHDDVRPQDRRSLVRAQNRDAIASAAADLVLRVGPSRLTVDELADRAGVSRRTVFNHFSSIEEAAFARVNDNFDRLVEDFAPDSAGTPETMSTSVSQALTEFVLRADVLEVIRDSVATAGRMVDRQGMDTWGQASIERMIHRLVAIVESLYPQAPAMHIHILCRVLVQTICVALHEALGDDGRGSSLAEARDKVREALEYLTTISFSSALKGI